MTQFEKLDQTKFNSVTYQVATPEGTMFVVIIEDNNGKMIALDLIIGKAGTLVSAWANSLARLMTVAIERGATIENLIEELSTQTSGAPARRRNDGLSISSGPDGISFVLMQYRQEKAQALRKEMGLGDHESTEREGRSPRLAR